jgi:hypothetical protein
MIALLQKGKLSHSKVQYLFQGSRAKMAGLLARPTAWFLVPALG